METLKVKKRMKRLLVEKNKESDNRQRDKLLIHLLAIKNPHLPAVTNGYKRFLLPNTSYGLENYESKPKKESNKGLEMKREDSCV